MKRKVYSIKQTDKIIDKIDNEELILLPKIDRYMNFKQFLTILQSLNIKISYQLADCILSSKSFNQQNMGNDQPTTASQPNNNQQTQLQDDEEFFVLENLQHIKLEGTANDMIFLWIDPRIYNDQNGKNLKIFKTSLKNIQEFSSISSLQNELNDIDTNNIVVVISAASLPEENFTYMNGERRIAEIVLFCQNEERAKLLMSNFSKIRNVGYNAKEVLQRIEELRKKYPTKGLIKNSMLFMTEDDAAIMNKYRLNYFCLTNQNNKASAKKDFETLARKFYPNQTQIIQDFVSKYEIGLSQQARRKQTLEWVFRDSFYWDLIESLPKVTTDPRKLAYLRLPVKDVYETILVGYQENKKRPKNLYIVVELNENQQQKLQQNDTNFLIFTTFVKGYTNEKKAHEEFKRRGPNAFKLDIILARNMFDSLDFGFTVIEQEEGSSRPNIIFNLYNFFQLTELSFKARRGTLQYGSLAKLFNLRENPSARKDLKVNERNLLRNYDYLEDLMKKIKNQGSVLQLSGYFKESIEIYDKKLEEITRTNKPAAMLDEFRIEKGDTLKSCEQYDLAEKEYFSVQTDKLKLVAKVRLIELYIMRRNEAKVQQIIDELQNDITKLKEWGFTEDYFRAKNYIGLSLMRKDKFKESKKYYKELKAQLSEYYDYKMEGIPLVHQIYRNLALSETKLNNHEEALNLLNSTKNWQQSSEGKGPTLILTEKMIQNVYQSKGDKDGVEQSKQAVQKLIEQSTIDINLIDASRGSVKVQQSIQQSLVAIDLDDVPKQREQRELLQQSAINIQF